MPAGTAFAIQFSTGVSGAHVLSPSPNLYGRKTVSVVNGSYDIRPTLLFRIMVANFAEKDVALAKNELLALALPPPSKIFTVNVDPRESKELATANVGLAQALQPEDALACFVARVHLSPAACDRFTAKDVSLDNLSDEDQAKACYMLGHVAGQTRLCHRNRTPN